MRRSFSDEKSENTKFGGNGFLSHEIHRKTLIHRFYGIRDLSSQNAPSVMPMPFPSILKAMLTNAGKASATRIMRYGNSTKTECLLILMSNYSTDIFTEPTRLKTLYVQNANTCLFAEEDARCSGLKTALKESTIHYVHSIKDTSQTL